MNEYRTHIEEYRKFHTGIRKVFHKDNDDK